jgi:formylglycine-generating enzyme required for sulfatase activity
MSKKNPVKEPAGIKFYRVFRGGAWPDDGKDARSARRIAFDPGVRVLFFHGFRLARTKK